MSYLYALQGIPAPYCHPQDTLLDFMRRQLPAQYERAHRALPLIYRRSSIAQRHSCLPDFGQEAAQLFVGPEPPSLEARMAHFWQHAPVLGLQACRAVLAASGTPATSITHLIAVSCTGLAAPGLEMLLQQGLGLPAHTQRYGVNFMGCYAAMHALRLADHIARSEPDAQVLLCCVELCTLHFQNSPEDDQLLANALFADGAAAALVSSRRPLGRSSLRMEGFFSHLSTQGAQHMAWEPSGQGFLMRLSSYVPDLLGADLEEVVRKAGMRNCPHWALHPGGLRVLQAVQQALGLSEQQMAPSLHVLRQYGNMSSASVLFVLQHLWTQLLREQAAEVPLGAMAFGPGLNTELAALTFLPH